MAHVNFPDNDAITQITATGGQTVFNTDYPLLDQTHIDVFQNGTLLTLTTHYTVSGLDNQSGATITLVTGATVNDILTLARNVPVERLTDYAVQGAFTAASVNLELDNIAQWSQQIERDLTGSIRTFVYDPQHNLNQIPVKDTRKGKLLAFDATTGHPVVSVGTLANLEALLVGTLGLGLDDNATGTVLTLEDTFTNQTVELRVAGNTVIDATGTILASALPSSVMEFKGVWNAATNAPTLVSGVGDDGDYYLVSVSGSTNLDGETDWVVGDALVFGNLIWNKLDNTDAGAAVSSVFGRTGAVIAVAGDYTASEVTNVIAGGISSIDVQGAINELDTEKQASDATLTALAGLTIANNQYIMGTGVDAFTMKSITAFGQSLVDDADAGTARTTLGLAALAVLATVNTAQVDDDAITYPKMQNVVANDRILGNIAGAGGVVAELTAAQVLTMINVEAAADVTDAANVAAAGAVMDSDFAAAEGFMRKTGAGAYIVHKSNLAAAVAPGVTDDGAAGYSVGSLWIDTTADKSYRCVDSTNGAAVWNDLTAGGGGGETNTMSSAGTAVETFNAKSGVDFPMRDLLGLATGGIDVTLNVNNIEFDLDISGMTADVTPVGTDEVAMQTTAGGALQKATLTNLSKGIDHDQLVNFDTNEHYLQSAINTVGIVATGDWTSATIISGRTLVTAVTGDMVLIEDLTDGTLKRVNASDFLAGSGDMVLADVQVVTGLKTFNDTKFALRNVADTFSASFVNTITANRIYALPDAAGTIQLGVIGTDIQAWAAVLDATTASFLVADESKLDGITITGALTGDVTTVVNAATIANNAVSLAKMADVATDSLMGRFTAATGDPEVITSASLTEELTPVATDFIVGFRADGKLVRYDIGNLPGGGGLSNPELVGTDQTFRQSTDGTVDVFVFDGTVTTGEMTAASGVQAFMRLFPQVAQTGTAGYNILEIDLNEVSQGSGETNLIWAGKGGSALFRVDDVGKVFLTDTLQITGAAKDIEIDGTTPQINLIGTNARFSLSHDNNSISTSTSGLFTFSARPSASSGQQLCFRVFSNDQQSGTAALDILRIEGITARVASGTYNALVIEDVGTDTFKINIDGTVTLFKGLYGTWEDAKTVPPGTGDDNTTGYAVGSQWIDVTADKTYTCVDASTGAAVWIETSAGAGGGETNTMSSAGATGVEIFNAKSGVDFPMRDLFGVATGGIDVTLNGSDIDFQLDIANMTADVTPVGTDEVAMQTTAGGALQKATLDNLSKGIDHNQLVNFTTTQHFTQATITQVGTVTTGNVDAVVSAATETLAGKSEVATQAEADTGTDDTRFISPLKMFHSMGNFKAVNAQTGTTYTAVAADAGKLITMDNAAANTLSINDSVFAAGDNIYVMQKGAGTTTIAGTASNNVNAADTLVLDGQWAIAQIYIDAGGATTISIVFGKLVAA